MAREVPAKTREPPRRTVTWGNETGDDKATNANKPKTETNRERIKPGVSEPLEPPKEPTEESHVAGKADGKTCCVMKVTAVA